jgi:hypothetical protein
MRSILAALAVVVAAGACGDNHSPERPLGYTDPVGGRLRLVENDASAGSHVVLDLVVGDEALTGYSVGFDLPIDDTMVSLGDFTPGTALSPGSAPEAALAELPGDGPLAHMLVTAQSQKASGPGAIATDTELAPGTVLYTIELDSIANAPAGVVFDGAAADFVLPSGGMRSRAGETVVAADDVEIGTLVAHRY